MAMFKLSLEKTKRWEGGYANIGADTPDPNDDDTGGETFMGISRNNHPNLQMWREIDNYKDILKPFDKTKIRRLETLCYNNAHILKDIENTYKNLYWDKIKGDLIKNQLSADVIFDFAVNAGTKKVIKLVQSFLDVTQDGIIGPKTLAAINSYTNFGKAFTEYRITWYMNRSARYDIFKKGWINRARDIAK